MPETRKERPFADWKVLSEEQLISLPPWLSVWAEEVELPDGRCVHPFYRIDQPDYVIIFPLTVSGRVVGIWHYKHGPGEETLGLPAGYVMSGEVPEDAARRELLEETGYAAKHWQSLGRYCVDGNRGCGWAHVFFAKGLSTKAQPQPDDLEEWELEEMPLQIIEEHLNKGRVRTLGAAAAISLGLRFLNTSYGA